MTNPTADVAGRVEPGIRMIGAEMRGFTDADSPMAPIGPAAIHVLRHALPRRGRVLIAGMHDADLIDAIIGLGLDVDLLLRSIPDARAARLRHTGAAAPRRVEVICGALDRLATTEAYDAVVALDGVDRLLSPDSTAVTWDDAIVALRSAVRPGGTVVVLVDNRFDLGRLSRVEPPHADYRPEGMLSPAEPPAGYASSIRSLARGELVVNGGFAVFPSRSHPALLMTADALAAPIAPTLVAAAYGADRDAHGDGVAHLAEPRRLARDAVRHGLGFELAPAWIVIAARAGGDPTSEYGGPDIVVTDADTDFWSVPQLVTRDAAGGWWRRPADPDAVERMLGYVFRDPGALTGPIATGELLEESLLAACAQHDHTAMRGLMRRYTDWLTAGAGPDGIAAAKVFGFLDNVLDTALGLELLDPSWSLERPVPVEVAVIHSSRRFAHRLLAGGHPHPWPSDASIDRVALTLIAMAGITSDSAVAESADLDLDAATRLAIDVDVRRGTGGEDRIAELTALFASTMPVRGLGHREVAALAARRATELADAREQIAWFDETVRERDEQLSIAGRSMAELRASITYRLGHLCTYPFIKILKVVRRGARG